MKVSCLALKAAKQWSPFPPISGMLAVSQNQPMMVGIKGVKTSHFMERKTAPRDYREADLRQKVNLFLNCEESRYEEEPKPFARVLFERC
jgi:hypothetical protein